MRVQVLARRTPPFEGTELERLEQAVARSLAPHASRLRRVVVSVDADTAALLRLRGEVFHDGGRLQVDHLDAGSLTDAASYFADRMCRAVTRAFSMARSEPSGDGRRG